MACAFKVPNMFDREKIVQFFLFGSLVVMTYEAYRIIQPFLVPIVWATLLAFIFHPLMVRARRFLRQKSLAALSITVVVALVAIIPSLWLSTVLATEASSLYAQSEALMAHGGMARVTELAAHSRLGVSAQKILAQMGLKLDQNLPRLALEGSRAISNTLVAYVTGIFKNMLEFCVDFALMLLILFYMLRDGEDYYHALRNLTPLHEDDKRSLFETLRMTLSSVMRGLMLTSLLQGVVIGLGLFLSGVPYWVFLSILTAVTGLLPLGGTAIVWAPASLYLGYETGWAHAIFLVGWSVVALAVIDNLIKPQLMGRGSGLPTLALFLGIAGGLEAYGAPGIFAGPAVIAMLASLLRTYNKSYNPIESVAA
jgi:predicted PurR-regulated permease PerM